MTARTLLLVTLGLLVGAAGLWIGRRAHAWDASARLPAPIRRSPALRGVLRAHEAGDRAALARGLEALGAERTSPEAVLVAALDGDDPAALQRLADDPAGGPTAARAALALWRRARDPQQRAARRAAFQARYPRSWVLATAWAQGR